MEEIVLVKDGTHKTPNYISSGVPFLRVTDLKNDYLDFSNIKFISREEHLELTKRNKPELGDILYSKNGTIGIPRLIDWDWEFSIFVSLALLKIKKKDLISASYLVKVLDSELVREQIRLRAKTGTVTNLHLEEIKEFLIPLPSLHEQEEICQYMNSVHTAETYESEKLKRLEELKQGLMQNLLTGRVRVEAVV